MPHRKDTRLTGLTLVCAFLYVHVLCIQTVPKILCPLMVILYEYQNFNICKFVKKSFYSSQVFNVCVFRLKLFSLETSASGELGSEFINFASNCVINTLRLIVYLTGLSI